LIPKFTDIEVAEGRKFAKEKHGVLLDFTSLQFYANQFIEWRRKGQIFSDALNCTLPSHNHEPNHSIFRSAIGQMYKNRTAPRKAKSVQRTTPAQRPAQKQLQLMH
jgi:hypothetical protein